MVSIIIVNYGDPKDTCECLESLNHISYTDHEVIVVDNGSSIDREKLFHEFNPSCKVVTRKSNGGFAAGANAGVRISQGEYILLLNNDTIVPEDFLGGMVSAMEEYPTVGIVSPQIRYYNSPETIQYAGATSIHPIWIKGQKLGSGQTTGHQYNVEQSTELCNGACMLIRRQIFEEVGLLPEKYFMYYEEHDFTERAKMYGWQCFYAGTSVIYHKHSQSLGHDSPLKTYYLFRNRVMYARTFQEGYKLALSLGYLYAASTVQVVRRVLSWDIPNARSIARAMAWHFTHPAISTK